MSANLCFVVHTRLSCSADMPFGGNFHQPSTLGSEHVRYPCHQPFCDTHCPTCLVRATAHQFSLFVCDQGDGNAEVKWNQMSLSWTRPTASYFSEKARYTIPQIFPTHVTCNTWPVASYFWVQAYHIIASSYTLLYPMPHQHLTCGNVFLATLVALHFTPVSQWVIVSN